MRRTLPYSPLTSGNPGHLPPNVRLTGRSRYRRNDDEIANDAMVRGVVRVPPGGLQATT